MNYTKLASKLINEAYLHGGATFDVDCKPITKGYAVGITNIYTGTMPEQRGELDIARKLEMSPENTFHSRLGSWFDTKTKILYIDAIRVYPYKVLALWQAKKSKEIAIYNLTTKEVIYNKGV